MRAALGRAFDRIAGLLRRREQLFSYGTLQLEKVQLETFGRRLRGRPDTLAGYRLGSVEIASEDVVAISGAATHPIVHATGNPLDLVAGMVFEVTPAELARADAYEADDYQRVRVTLSSGTRAWVYAAAMALAAPAANAKPIIDATTTYYTVTGATEAELSAALAQRPLAPNGRPQVGVTHPAEVRWRFEARERKGRCLVVSVTVTLLAVTTLPRWQAPAEAPPELRRSWASFIEALTRHEQGHVDIALQAARKIEDALWRAPAPKACGEVREALDALANRIFDAAVQQQRDFDAATDFGRTQGVAFP